MNKLLRADFARLWKNKAFFVGLLFMFGTGSALVLKQYQQLKVYGIPVKLETTFFTYALFIGVVSAVFCSLLGNCKTHSLKIMHIVYKRG